jgi:hypothetical protein
VALQGLAPSSFAASPVPINVAVQGLIYLASEMSDSTDDVVLRRPRKRVRKQHRDEDVLLFIGAL